MCNGVLSEVVLVIPQVIDSAFVLVMHGIYTKVWDDGQVTRLSYFKDVKSVKYLLITISQNQR